MFIELIVAVSFTDPSIRWLLGDFPVREHHKVYIGIREGQAAIIPNGNILIDMQRNSCKEGVAGQAERHSKRHIPERENQNGSPNASKPKGDMDTRGTLAGFATHKSSGEKGADGLQNLCNPSLLDWVAQMGCRLVVATHCHKRT